MKKRWLMVVGVVLVLAVVSLSGCTNGSLEGLPSDLRVSLENQQEGVWVNGTGTVTVVPDVATLRLGVEVRADTVEEANSQAAVAMEAVMTSLDDNGVAGDDIQTRYYSVYPVRDWDKEGGEEFVGYRVTNVVSAKIRDMEAVGQVIDAVAAAGGDFTRIDSLDFSVDDPSIYYEEAREKAMADARERAEQLAELAGGTLGRARYISENSYGSVPVYRQDVYAEADYGSVPTPVSAGELEDSLSVQVGYDLLT